MGLFGSKDKDEFNIVFDKYCSLIEGLIPIEGFINGLDYPTPADLAVVNICEGYMPFGSAYKITELNFDVKFPKMKALCDRTKSVKEVGTLIAESKTLKAALFGL